MLPDRSIRPITAFERSVGGDILGRREDGP
jgi:hypothetical protein